MPDSPPGTDTFTLDVTEWLNSEPLSVDALRGRVVVIETFQMLCPGCISHGLPLAQRIRRAFDPREVVVLGLHTVFEHHAVMQRDALAVFLSEYRIDFPVAIDRPIEGQAVPATMRRYQLPGTPSTLIIDRSGHLRQVFFGPADDLTVGAALGELLAEPSVASTLTAASPGELSQEAVASTTCSVDGTCA